MAASNDLFVSRTLELLGVLTTPDSKNIKEPGNLIGLDLLLDTNLKSYQEFLTQEKYTSVKCKLEDIDRTTWNSNNIRCSFVCACLNLLILLQEVIEKEIQQFEADKSKEQKELKPSQAPPLSPDALSIKQQKTVLTAIQFIVILGICPNLDRGAGIPLEHRSEFAKSLSNSEEKCSDEQKKWRLYSCVSVFMHCLKIPSLGALILSRHLNDLLVSLLQLLYGQKKPGDKFTSSDFTETVVQEGNVKLQNPKSELPLCNSGETSTGESKELEVTSADWTPASVVDMVKKSGQSDHTSEALHDNQALMDEKIGDKELVKCDEWLQQLLNKVFQPMLVRELIVLQGAPRPKNKSVNTGKPPVPPSPAWLRRICGRLLTDILMKPKGVINVLRGMLEGAAGTEAAGKITESQTSDWRKCDAVAKVIACCPLQSSSVEEYYKHVAPQVIQILHYPDKAVSKQFLRVACSTLSAMMKQHPTLTDKYLLSPLIGPLTKCCRPHSITDHQIVVIGEKDLSLCIEDLHKVFVCGIEPGGIVKCLLSVCPVLFALYCHTKQGVSHLRSACLEILGCVLKGIDRQTAMILLKNLALENSQTSENEFMMMHPSLTFAAGDKGGTVVITRESDSIEELERDITGLVDLLKELQKDGLTGDFFLFLMNELTNLISKEVNSETLVVPESAAPEQELLSAEISQQETVDAFNRKMAVLHLLAAICEEIGPSCVKNTQQTLQFVQVTLERGVQVCQHASDDVTQAFETETLTMAMGMLTAILTGTIPVSDGDRNHMKTLMPLLEDISSGHPDNTVQEMASDLRVAIATHGVIWSELLKTKGELTRKKDKPPQKSQSTKRQKKPLVEVINDNVIDSNNSHSDIKTDSNYNTKLRDTKIDHTEKKPEMKETVSNKEDEKQTMSDSRQQQTDPPSGEITPKSDLQSAIENLQDPLLPVRGHGLIMLTKLLKKRDADTLLKQSVLLDIFQENLYHPDSYLYLAAVNGLVALADRIPDDVLPILTQQFLQTDTRKSDNRIKVGECLVQVSRNLGDMAAKYRDLLLSTFLRGCRDQDSFVRASSLSNLGDLCKVLKFSLGNFVHEILNCSCTMLKSDIDTEVRQAAGLMITLVLQGLGKDSLKVLESAIHEIYRILRQVMMTEKEDKVKVHVTLALNELDAITRDVLFPKQTLQKKIRILSAD